MGRSRCSIKKYDWKIIDKNNITITLNVLYAKKEKIYPVYVSKYNPNCKKHAIILIIRNRKGWYYLSVKKLSALTRGIMSKHYSDFYCLNCLHSFRTKSKLESQKNMWK